MSIKVLKILCMNLAKTPWIATSKVFYEEKFWSLFHIWPLWSLANTKNDDERSWISCSMPYHWHLQYHIENKMDLSQLTPKEKRVFNNIPNLCFELREIENAKLRTLFCQKVQDLDRALFCEMVNTREGAERKTRIELLLLKTTSLSSGRGILAKSIMINLVTGHKNQRPKMKFEIQCRWILLFHRRLQKRHSWIFRAKICTSNVLVGY